MLIYRDVSTSEIIVVNVGGARFHLSKSQLNRQPGALLMDNDVLGQNYRSVQNEFYFDRNPRAFRAIASYYKTENLHLPKVSQQ